MKCFLISVFLLFTMPLIAQEGNVQLEQGKQELLKVDAEFSKLSESRGVNEAFLTYLADNGVLLRPNNHPTVGKAIIEERFFSRPDSGYTLTWEPLYADIAESGELGYTFGVYEFRAADTEGGPIIRNGTYVSIWKKINPEIGNLSWIPVTRDWNQKSLNSCQHNLVRIKINNF